MPLIHKIKIPDLGTKLGEQQRVGRVAQILEFQIVLWDFNQQILENSKTTFDRMKYKTRSEVHRAAVFRDGIRLLSDRKSSTWEFDELRNITYVHIYGGTLKWIIGRFSNAGGGVIVKPSVLHALKSLSEDLKLRHCILCVRVCDKLVFSFPLHLDPDGKMSKLFLEIATSPTRSFDLALSAHGFFFTYGMPRPRLCTGSSRKHSLEVRTLGKRESDAGQKGSRDGTAKQLDISAFDAVASFQSCTTTVCVASVQITWIIPLNINLSST
ncbi:hypothetical protein OIU85_016817 [Salix viminalis]|uniref:Uncharacterized protein n=1 Tax=Salix viminalis TaxID=40686 RepID=A0A9Q0ZQ28_SALVM|nr:hypothetical protein OIU85_016817 [Salix viminalis]